MIAAAMHHCRGGNGEKNGSNLGDGVETINYSFSMSLKIM